MTETFKLAVISARLWLFIVNEMLRQPIETLQTESLQHIILESWYSIMYHRITSIAYTQAYLVLIWFGLRLGATSDERCSMTGLRFRCSKYSGSERDHSVANQLLFRQPLAFLAAFVKLTEDNLRRVVPFASKFSKKVNLAQWVFLSARSGNKPLPAFQTKYPIVRQFLTF